MTQLNHSRPNTFTSIHPVADITLTPPVIVIQGLPGMGLIGKIAAQFLISYYDAQEIARIYSSFFPPVVQIDSETSLGRLTRMEIFAVTDSKPNMLIITGDAQPHDIGIVQVLNDVLDYVATLHAETVICLGGLRVHDEGPDVAAFGYSSKTLDWLTQYDIEPLRGGEVTGAVGVLSALAAERNMTSFGLLGKLTLAGTDPLASKVLLSRINDIYDLGIDLDGLDITIKEAQAKNERISSLAREVLEKNDDEESGKDPGYYI
ncbi:MAG: PAC2 family protein [Candidatus Thorarchaeota archaeon]